MVTSFAKEYVSLIVGISAFPRNRAGLRVVVRPSTASNEVQVHPLAFAQLFAWLPDGFGKLRIPLIKLCRNQVFVVEEMSVTFWVFVQTSEQSIKTSPYPSPKVLTGDETAQTMW